MIFFNMNFSKLCTGKSDQILRLSLAHINQHQVTRAVLALLIGRRNKCTLKCFHNDVTSTETLWVADFKNTI